MIEEIKENSVYISLECCEGNYIDLRDLEDILKKYKLIKEDDHLS
jgi:predicted methyltransferase